MIVSFGQQWMRSNTTSAWANKIIDERLLLVKFSWNRQLCSRNISSGLVLTLGCHSADSADCTLLLPPLPPDLAITCTTTRAQLHTKTRCISTISWSILKICRQAKPGCSSWRTACRCQTCCCSARWRSWAWMPALQKGRAVLPCQKQALWKGKISHQSTQQQAANSWACFLLVMISKFSLDSFLAWISISRNPRHEGSWGDLAHGTLEASGRDMCHHPP